MDHLHTTEASSLLHPWSQIGWPSRYTLPLVTVPPRLPGFRLPSRLTCPEAYVGKKHPRKLTSHLKYFLICDQGPSSSEIPHCSSFRHRWMCLCDSCNPHPWAVCALKLDLWDTFLLTSRIPIRRGCPPFSIISGPPESPLHASVINPSVREAVYSHSSSTCTYHDFFNCRNWWWAHTSYLSRAPRVYPCKFFLAGGNFYRFNAKNWHFRQVSRKKVVFFTD